MLVNVAANTRPQLSHIMPSGKLRAVICQKSFESIVEEIVLLPS